MEPVDLKTSSSKLSRIKKKAPLTASRARFLLARLAEATIESQDASYPNLVEDRSFSNSD